MSAKAPPFLLVHGTADQVVPAEHSQRLHELLRAAGARSIYLPGAGAGHELTSCTGIERLISDSVHFFATEPHSPAQTGQRQPPT